MDVKLVVAKGKTTVREIPLSAATTIVGRRTDCGLRIPSPLVSRQHCELMCSGDRLIVKDLGSSNGTFVNGSRVNQKELKSGDTLGVGPVTFIVQLGGEPISPGDTARPRAATGVAADDAGDFVVAEDVSTGEPADFVLGEALADDEAADFVAAEEAAPAAAEFVAADEAAEAEAPDFVVAAEAAEEGETVHDMNIADLIASEGSDEPAAAEQVAEAGGEPEPEKPKKKPGIFGRLFKKKAKKTKATEKPTSEAPPAPAKQSPVSATAKATPDAKEPEEALPQFVVEDETPQASGDKPVDDDALADFLMGLNEKDK